MKTLASEMRTLVKKLKAGKLTRAQWKAGLDRLSAKYPDPRGKGR